MASSAANTEGTAPATPAAGERVAYRRLPELGASVLHARYRTHNFARHYHDELTLGFVEYGAGGFEHEGSTQVAQPGHVVVINPGEVHTGYAAVPEGWIQCMVYVEVPVLAQAMLEVTGKAPARFPVFEGPLFRDPALAGDLARLHGLLLAGNDELACEEAMLAVARGLAAHGRPALEPEDAEHGRAGEKAADRAREYLEAHWSEPVTLGDLAQAAGVSRAHLVRSFARSHGMPPHAWLNQQRVRAAARLLDQGESPAEVAAACAFADQSHLTRVFKRLTGVTPGVYARRSTFVQDPPA